MRMALTAAIRMDVAASLHLQSTSSHPDPRNGDPLASQSGSVNSKKSPSLVGSVGNASAEVSTLHELVDGFDLLLLAQAFLT